MSFTALFSKYIKTAPAGSEEELHTKKLDELIKQFNALLVKLDADTGVIDVNYSSLLKIKKSASDMLIASPKKQST